MSVKIGNEASSSNISSSSSSSSNRGETVVTDVGKRRNFCGYCKSLGRSSISHGLWAHSMTVDDYQDLLDRGWRRSGSYIYKPEMEKACCPAYTIRLKAGDFLPTKEQLRASRRLQRFVDGTFDGKKQIQTEESSSSSSDIKENISENSEKNKEEQSLLFLSQQIDSVVDEWSTTGEYASSCQFPKASVKEITHAKKRLIEGSGDLLYSSNISFQIAAALKRSKVTEKVIDELGLSTSSMVLNGQYHEILPKIVAEKLTFFLNKEGRLPGFTIRACNGYINFHAASEQVSSGKGSRITSDSKIHSKAGGGKRSSVVKNNEYPQKKRCKLEIHLKQSSFDSEEYALYRKYQILVHNDKEDHVMESSYRRFLVDTPIVYVPPGDNQVPPCGFGSFHQQYVIDGKLVAVGVVDILPRCLSSKYLFWDPDFAFLSLGKYSALQEISWVKANSVHCPSLQYYYLGYYIHSCSKMRYKAAYQPSELLCPLRYQWVPFVTAKHLLDKQPYVILSDYANLQNELSFSQPDAEDTVELQHHDPNEDRIVLGSDEDDEVMELNFDSSEDDSDPETQDALSVHEIEDGDVDNVLMGLKNTRMRYKELRAFGSENNYLELQLHRYQKVVGSELSERMVYSLG